MRVWPAHTPGMVDVNAGRYFSTWGPLDGTIREHDHSPALGVLIDPAAPRVPRRVAYPWEG